MNKRYARMLQHPKWIEKRFEKMEQVGHKCEACGSETNIEVHHNVYRGKYPWDALLEDLEVLCAKCHNDIHNKKPTMADVELAVCRSIILHMKPDVFCDRCGDLVTNAQGYGRTGRRYYCEHCVRQMEMTNDVH